MSDTETTPEWLPVKGICQMFSLSSATVNRWWRKELIDSAKVGTEGDGRARLIDVASVRKYLNSKRNKG